MINRKYVLAFLSLSAVSLSYATTASVEAHSGSKKNTGSAAASGTRSVNRAKVSKARTGKDPQLIAGLFKKSKEDSDKKADAKNKKHADGKKVDESNDDSDKTAKSAAESSAPAQKPSSPAPANSITGAAANSSTAVPASSSTGANANSTASSPAGSSATALPAGEAVPPLLPDAAMISVLRDVSRALKESPDVEKIEDPCQKAATIKACAALEQALSSSELPSNRIVTMKERPAFESSMTAESWSSGDIKLADNCHASANAIWAKKLDGLLAISVAGNCGCKDADAKLGEFVFVAQGKTAMDKGFDIQSQSDVNFWLGKLSNFSVDYACQTEEAAGNAALKTTEQKSTLILKALVTERTREHMAAEAQAAEKQKELIAKAEAERKKQEEEAQAKIEAQAKTEREKAQAGENVKEAQGTANAHGVGNAPGTSGSPGAACATDAASASGTGSASGAVPAADGSANSAAGADKLNVSSAPPAEAPILPSPAVADDPRALSAAHLAMTNMAPSLPPAVSPNRGWDSPGPAPAARVPSSQAQMLLPDKAVAGQFLTAAVLNQNHAGESLVELSFNGAVLATSHDGKALYMVPDDAIPGPTLQVSMAARPEQAANAVQVLQPLAVPSGPQIPRVDRVSPVAESNGLLVIEGHNFDGVADRNRVIIDGAYDARILASSPVQLKVDLPGNLNPGIHNVSVSTAGLRSNPGQFEMVSFDVKPVGKDAARDDITRLAVHVLGTAQPVRVHIRNFTPDVLKLARGTELVTSSPGGNHNVIVLPVQRLRKGQYHVDVKMH